jgi:hypothetical protein
MNPTQGAGFSTARLVRQEFKRRDVQRDLGSRGFKACLLGTNIYALNRLTVDQYKNFLQLLDHIRAYISSNFVVDANQTLTLDLPWPQQLRTVNFEKLLKNPQAVTEVLNRCVMPEGKPLISLEILPWIYKEYVAIEPQK